MKKLTKHEQEIYDEIMRIKLEIYVKDEDIKYYANGYMTSLLGNGKITYKEYFDIMQNLLFL